MELIERKLAEQPDAEELSAAAKAFQEKFAVRVKTCEIGKRGAFMNMGDDEGLTVERGESRDEVTERVNYELSAEVCIVWDV